MLSEPDLLLLKLTARVAYFIVAGNLNLNNWTSILFVSINLLGYQHSKFMFVYNNLLLQSENL